jgi:hypothetical protein
VVGTTAVAAGVGGPPMVHYVQHATSGHEHVVARARPASVPAISRDVHVYETDVSARHPVEHPVVVHLQKGPIASTQHQAGESGGSQSRDAFSGDQGAAQPDQSQSDSPPSPDLQSPDGGSVTPQLQQQAAMLSSADQTHTETTSTDGGGGSPSGN